MSATLKAIIHLHRDGFTQQQIATMLGISQATVRLQLSEAIAPPLDEAH